VVNVAPPNGKYSTIIASGVPGVGKGEKTMIVQCPHCGMIVHLGRVTGREPLSITVKNVCDALQAHGTVTAAAKELGCSRGYIYHELAKYGTTPKEVVAAKQKVAIL
jgi:hypothetical protein